MNKSELITAIAEKSGLTKKESEIALSAFIDTVTETLTNGEKIQIVGFGSFELIERAAREGVNPATGTKIHIEASKSPKFKAGKGLKDTVNGK